MNDETVDRVGAVSGIAAVVLGIAAIGLGGGGSSANPGATVAEVARVYATAPSSTVWIGAYLEVIAFLLLFVFVGRLSGAMGRSPNEAPRWLASVMLGAGFVAVALTLAGFAIGAALRYRGGPDVQIQSALALFDVHVALYVASWAFAAVFFGALAAIILGADVLPRWLGWLAGVIAVLDLLAVGFPTGPLAQFPNLLLLVWVLASGIVLLRRRPIAPFVDVAAAQSPT